MAYSIIPSVEWQKILDMTDEKEQGIAATKYVYELETRIKYIDHICKCNYEESERLIEKYKENLFSSEFISDEEAEMLYHTILNWKDKSEMYDDLCK